MIAIFKITSVKVILATGEPTSVYIIDYLIMCAGAF